MSQDLKLHRLFPTAILAACLGAQAATFSGHVFEDRNANGARDPGEPGIPGVRVSDGVAIVTTDADGAYSIATDSPTVFVIKPSGWTLASDSRNLPQFYRRSSGDFALVRKAESDDFNALIATDTQPSSPKEVGYLNRSLVDTVARRKDLSFGVTLGDLVYDRPDLFPALAESLSRIGIPWHNLPGNHDLQLLAGSEAQALKPFADAFGPSTYAFFEGKALFIALDDVRPRGGPRYVGGFTEGQFSFLKALLGSTPTDTLVVPMVHIPLFVDAGGPETFRLADRRRLFDLLARFPHVLVLSSHTHVQRHVFHDAASGWTGSSPLHEYNVAAACGGFWGGPPGPTGLPPATMWDGTPPGCAVLTVKGNAYSLAYLPTEFPADHQIGLYVPPVIATGLGYVTAYANVYNSHPGWTVTSRVDGRSATPMTPTVGWDPSYAAAFVAQDQGPSPAVGARLPDPVICYHLYKTYLPADLAAGTHRLETTATDPDGHAYTASASFSVKNR